MSKKEEHFNKKDIQTHLKHILLDDYVTNWSSVLANASRGINLKKVHYIDGFAGKGYFDDGNDGSPKIAVKRLFDLQQLLQEKYESTLQFYIHTIEFDKTYFEELNKIKFLTPYPSQISNYLGKFENHVDSLLKKTNGSPALYFIDPFGYKGVTMKDIKKILSIQSHEVLINVMSYSILRNSTIETSQIELCNFFGIDKLPQNMQEFIIKARDIEKNNLSNTDVLALNLEESIIELYKKTISKGENHEKIYILSKRIHSLSPFTFLVGERTVFSCQEWR